MDINTMLTKRAKLLERIEKLSSRIERDKVSLQKAKDELKQTMKDLTDSADLMADILELDPDQVRDKLLQQSSGEVSSSLSPGVFIKRDPLQDPPADKKDSNSSVVINNAAQDPMEALSEETAASNASNDTQEGNTNESNYGLKIDPFSQAL